MTEKDEKTATELLGCLVTVVSAVILMPISYVINGYALMKLWQWFIATTFKVQTLSLVQAIGLGMIISFLTYKPNFDGKKTELEESKKALMAQCVWAFMKPVAALIVGYAVKLFM